MIVAVGAVSTVMGPEFRITRAEWLQPTHRSAVCRNAERRHRRDDNWGDYIPSLSATRVGGIRISCYLRSPFTSGLLEIRVDRIENPGTNVLAPEQNGSSQPFVRQVLG